MAVSLFIIDFLLKFFQAHIKKKGKARRTGLSFGEEKINKRMNHVCAEAVLGLPYSHYYSQGCWNTECGIVNNL